MKLRKYTILGMMCLALLSITACGSDKKGDTVSDKVTKAAQESTSAEITTDETTNEEVTIDEITSAEITSAEITSDEETDETDEETTKKTTEEVSKDKETISSNVSNNNTTQELNTTSAFYGSNDSSYVGLVGKTAASYGLKDDDLKKIDGIIGNITNGNMSKVEKIRAVHDWMVKNICYDLTLKHCSALSALNEGLTVCDGYSSLFRIFMSELNITNKRIIGKADNGERIDGHGWNAVQLDDGYWYYVDVTWDDPLSGGTSDYKDGSNMSYTYLLTTYKEISKTHTASYMLDLNNGTSTFYNDVCVAKRAAERGNTDGERNYYVSNKEDINSVISNVNGFIKEQSDIEWVFIYFAEAEISSDEVSGYIESAMSGTTCQITCSEWTIGRVGYVQIRLTSNSDAGGTEDNAPKDTTPPVITFSELPKAGTTSLSKPEKITVYTDEPAQINFNGHVSNGYVTEFEVTVEYNATYYCTALDEAGNRSELNIDITCFKDNSGGLTIDDILN